MIAPPNVYKPIQYGDLVALKVEAESAQATARAEPERAGGSAAQADESAALARQWAANPEDEEVLEGRYSALHYAARAAKSAASLDMPDLSYAAQARC